MTKLLGKAHLTTLLKETGEVFRFCAKKTKILAALSWGPEVAREFFKNKGEELPKPKYAVDKKGLKEVLEALKTLEPKLQGTHPVLHFLSRTCDSYQNGVNLLLEVEGEAFYSLSCQLYGNSQTRLFNGQTSNLELAQAIAGRMAVCNLNDIIQENIILKNAEEFRDALEKRLAGRMPLLPVKVEITDQIVAKVVAGANRVRIRGDARFSDIDLIALWNHEIESHCLTAQNGALQPVCDFLASGGPRTTMTQEGLAVFYEVYGHSMSQHRFLTLCNRIEAVSKVEDGASFIDLYRWYLSLGDSESEAFYNAQRIFRGTRLEGRRPFTKDVVYLAGLLGVYNFLRIAVKNQNRLLVESLVCGRMALEDVATIAWLRAHGIVSPPHFVPDWLSNWEALLSFFSLSAVLGAMDLSSFQGYFDDYYTLEDWDLSL